MAGLRGRRVRRPRVDHLPVVAGSTCRRWQVGDGSPASRGRLDQATACQMWQVTPLLASRPMRARRGSRSARRGKSEAKQRRGLPVGRCPFVAGAAIVGGRSNRARGLTAPCVGGDSATEDPPGGPGQLRGGGGQSGERERGRRRGGGRAADRREQTPGPRRPRRRRSLPIATSSRRTQGPITLRAAADRITGRTSASSRAASAQPIP